MQKTRKPENPRRFPAWDERRPFFPLVRSTFKKVGTKWVLTEREERYISAVQCGYVLDPRGLPFESRHQFQKRDRYSHSHAHDTFISWSPDGATKTVYYIDFAAGEAFRLKAIRQAKARKYSRKKKLSK